MGTPDAGLQHAAAPHRDASLCRRIVDRDSLAEATHTAHLDVDDLAGLHVDGCQRVTAVTDRFVEANGCRNAFLQHGMEVKIVVPERLLNHQQFKLVPAGDVVEVLHPVGGVRIAAQQNLRPARPHRFEDACVPAGLAFQLDALVSGGEFAGDLIHQLVQRRLDADRDPARDDLARSAQQLEERHTFHLGLEVPHGVLERCLGHPMAANRLEQIRTFASAREHRLQQARRQLGLGDDPGRVDHLVAEVGVLPGDPLAPGGQAVGLELDQQDASARGEAEARLKRIRQRHVDLAQVNGIYLEHVRFPVRVNWRYGGGKMASVTTSYREPSTIKANAVKIAVGTPFVGGDRSTKADHPLRPG